MIKNNGGCLSLAYAAGCGSLGSGGAQGSGFGSAKKIRSLSRCLTLTVAPRITF